MKDTIAVRKGEELNPIILSAFLREKLPELPDAELEIEQFGSGHSNLTYLLKYGDFEAVLRRPPIGPIAPKAHDMEREYNILTSLQPYFPAIPKTYLFSNDDSIVGAPFFLMERRKGIVLDTEFPSAVSYTKEIGRCISEKMVDTLVELHSIDYKQTTLAQMSKPEGFMERQVEGWIGRYEQAKTDDIPEVEELKNWLREHLPSSGEATIIHYDYKLNNTMFSRDFAEVTGLFDWEMTTVGDPLADVGVALSYWIQPDDPPLLKTALGKPPVTVLEGFYTREEFVYRYAEKSGRDVSDIHFYLTFAYFKLAVIGQQIYYRYKKGQTKDPRFSQFKILVHNLIKFSLLTAKNG
ncbi:phosphotransferase family protein [Lysinibacillus odysseyi]|uniref:Aminoglycoside phosphotransferase n=1 Tax=Lysinibacillus odysseyi 34hs-1 = NBRC 100172 TaxID=1220589 RepID=A0A0A3ITY8_9BACI|nr:phosphotransferase family protein [Lysinibacillus odysseyi]KGR88186.1 aminoglycoside phosphotransferase [Lysinibacillus odysseyi 34hs-1 = NBRC 100172]